MYQDGKLVANSASREEIAAGLYRAEVTDAGMPVSSEAMLAGG